VSWDVNRDCEEQIMRILLSGIKRSLDKEIVDRESVGVFISEMKHNLNGFLESLRILSTEVFLSRHSLKSWARNEVVKVNFPEKRWWRVFVDIEKFYDLWKGKMKAEIKENEVEEELKSSLVDVVKSLRKHEIEKAFDTVRTINSKIGNTISIKEINKRRIELTFKEPLVVTMSFSRDHSEFACWWVTQEEAIKEYFRNNYAGAACGSCSLGFPCHRIVKLILGLAHMKDAKSVVLMEFFVKNGSQIYCKVPNVFDHYWNEVSCEAIGDP